MYKKFFLYFTTVVAFFLLPGKIISQQLLDSLALDTTKTFTSIENALKTPDQVEKLELRKLKLKEFPKEILQFKNLQYLDLGKNEIKSIPDEISSLSLLQVLILERNSLVALPTGIGSLKYLKNLNVNRNELYSIPPEIGKLENLQNLDLWSNNLGSLPDELKNLKNLKTLDLRAILISTTEQDKISLMFPNTKIYFSASCNCKY